MKIASGKATDNFLKNPDKGIIATLIYGPDIGMASQRAEILSKTIVADLHDPFRVIDLPSDKIKSDNAILYDEISAMSFGGGRRLIRIPDAIDSIADIIADNLKSAENLKSIDSFVVVIGGDLDARSKLRKLFEARKNLAAIACYPDDERSIKPIIQDEMRKYGLIYDTGAISILAEYCRGDRLIVSREVEKISLYKGLDKNVSESDVASCIGETTESTYDDINVAVAEGNQALLEKHLRKALLQGEMPIVIIRLVYRYFNKIQVATNLINKGVPKDEAMRSLGLFWKSIPSFTRLIDKWLRKEAALWRIAEILYQAELDCKKPGSDAELICKRYLFRIAGTGRY